MKKMILSIVIVFSTLNAFSQNQNHSYTITVTLTNCNANTGNILTSLHTKNTFMKSKGIDNNQIKSTTETVTITFKNVAAGEYAIMSLHDANENYQMDFDINGMPKEQYGMSNNPVFLDHQIFKKLSLALPIKM